MNNVETYDLNIEQYCTSSLIAGLNEAGVGVQDHDVRVRLDWHITTQAHALTATLRRPADVLQDDHIIASYPDGLWQHIRSLFTKNYRRIEVRLTEHLVFPEIAIPEHPLRKSYRVFVQTDIGPFDPRNAYVEDYL